MASDEFIDEAGNVVAIRPGRRPHVIMAASRVP
jgi:hypothetical protein